MSVNDFDAQTVGEHPDVVIARCVSEIDELRAENAHLREQLAAAQSQRDSASAQLSHYRTHYTRTGW
jgi:hypothetical protein